jgi:UbiD family decarboxylase
VAKVVIVVDSDVELMALPQVMAAIRSRWRPAPSHASTRSGEN